MKNNLIIIGVFILTYATLSPSCKKGVGDFLDKPPGVDVTEDTIFSSKAEVETFITGTYRLGIHSMLAIHDATTENRYFLTSAASDESETGASWGEPNVWNTGGLTNTNVNFQDYRYHTRWQVVRRCNILLERMDGVQSVDQGYKDQVKGEAKFIRAMNYFEMLKRYGGEPIVDRRLLSTDSLLIPRSSIEDVVNFIVKDCNDAIAMLPSSYPSNMKGRATKGAALMVKSRTLLFAASPQFNTATPYLDFGANNKLICYGNYDKNRWQLAADAAKAILDWAPTAGCSLITDKGATKNYEYVWTTNDNAEIILANKLLGAVSKTKYPYLGLLPTSIYAGYGGLSITLNFLKKYEKKDGTPQTWDPAGGNNLNEKYAELDPRFAQSIAYNGSFWNSEYPEIQTYQGGAHAVQCFGGAWLRKFVPATLKNANTVTANNYLMRLAEAYLNYAEALNEAQGPVQAAYDAVNTIRVRSGMPALPPGLNQNDFRERVRNERAIELAFEDFRLWDIRRWLIAENDGVMKGNMYGLQITKIPGSSNFHYQPYVFESRSFNTNMYLHPFLIAEVNKGYLVQNPGW